MAKKEDICYGFVYTPKAPSCTCKDGSVDYAKYHEMLTAAKQGNHEAQEKIFEQHQGIWKSLSTEFKDKIEQSFMDWDDFQQEAFVSTMVALGKYDDETYEKSYSDYFAKIFRNNLVDIVRRQSKQVNVNVYLCSLDATDEEGRELYQIPDTSEMFFQKCYPCVERLLTEQELKIAIALYEYGLTIKEVSAQFHLSSRTIDSIVRLIKEKLKICVF